MCMSGNVLMHARCFVNVCDDERKLCTGHKTWKLRVRILSFLAPVVFMCMCRAYACLHALSGHASRSLPERLERIDSDVEATY